MSNLEFNKAFAGILVAGLVAMGAGMVSSGLVSPTYPEKTAYEIEIDVATSGGAAEEVEEVIPPISPLLAAADLARGEKLANQKCGTCHTFNEGGATKQGPNLYEIVNRDIGAVEGFGYSGALTAAEGAWDYEQLSLFLLKPKKHLPGTKMNFAGLKKEADRANIIAWLRTQAASPAPIPAE